MSTLVSAVRDVVVRCPERRALRLVSDIALLEPFERKARHVEIHPETAHSGWYRIEGRLAGVMRWDGDFLYSQHEHGWHSESRTPRRDGWRISGGFLVSRVDDETTRVTHYEDYLIPTRYCALAPVWRAYVRRTQVGEMRDVARLLEASDEPAPLTAPGAGAAG